MRWLALLVFLAVPCRAQVVEVNGGASTIYSAAGASATFHFGQSDLQTGVGYAGGHLAFGFTDTRTWRGWNVSLGDKVFSSSVGLGFVERGVALSRDWKRAGTLSLFAGSTGPAYSTPFFAAAISQHFGAGVAYEFKARGFQLTGVAALAGPQHTAAASAEYRTRTLRLAGAGGILQGARYWNAHVSEALGRHWRVDEYIGQSAGHWTVNFGGGYSGNRLTAALGYQEFYVPALVGQSPFQRALTITISFRAPHDSAATVAANISPTGAVQWAAYGGTFVSANWSESDQHPASRIKSGYEIRGVVVDSTGAPVEGAAVAVGSEIAYSDSAGRWAVRLRRARPANVQLAVGEFAAPGNWDAPDAPVSVMPQPDSAAQSVTLIARRITVDGTTEK